MMSLAVFFYLLFGLTTLVESRPKTPLAAICIVAAWPIHVYGIMKDGP